MIENTPSQSGDDLAKAFANAGAAVRRRAAAHDGAERGDCRGVAGEGVAAAGGGALRAGDPYRIPAGGRGGGACADGEFGAYREDHVGGFVKASASFLKKRSKKPSSGQCAGTWRPSPSGLTLMRRWTTRESFFASFFSKKEALPCLRPAP